MLIIDFQKLVAFLSNLFTAIAKITSSLGTLVNALTSTGITVRVD